MGQRMSARWKLEYGISTRTACAPPPCTNLGPIHNVITHNVITQLRCKAVGDYINQIALLIMHMVEALSASGFNKRRSSGKGFAVKKCDIAFSIFYGYLLY